MELLTTKQVLNAWGVSERLVRRLCIEGRIPNAAQEFGAWMIPSDGEKPGRKPRPKNKRKAQKPAAASLSAFAKRVVYQRNKNTHFGIYEYIQVNLTYSSNRMASNRLTRNEVVRVSL